MPHSITRLITTLWEQSLIHHKVEPNLKSLKYKFENKNCNKIKYYYCDCNTMPQCCSLGFLKLVHLLSLCNAWPKAFILRVLGTPLFICGTIPRVFIAMGSRHACSRVVIFSWGQCGLSSMTSSSGSIFFLLSSRSMDSLVISSIRSL